MGFGVVLDGEAYADDVKAGECLQAAWLATRPEATNFGLLAMERARNVDEVLALAPRVGIPGQNLVIGRCRGPHRLDLVRPRAARQRDPIACSAPLEFRDASDHPRIADPPVGRLWTANQRVVDGPLEAVLGDDEVDVGAGGYDIGARARQIRDDLLGLTHPATEADMLAIQLDSRALFVARWRELLLSLIDEQAMQSSAAAPRIPRAGEPVEARGGAGRRSATGWCAPFAANVGNALWRGLTTAVAGEKFEGKRPAQFEAAGWRLVNEQPAAIKPPRGDDWRAFLLLELDDTIADAGRRMRRAGGMHLRSGSRPVEVRHPLSRAVPVLSAPARHAGARVAGRPSHAARAGRRLWRVASDSRCRRDARRRAICELPGGPSGHPLSPFYRSGFEDWAAGKPTPFLPGPAAHKLVAQPASPGACSRCGSMNDTRFTGTDRYVATPDLMMAVNAAVTLARPLLIKGEPGTGKTQLAEEIARSLSRPLYEWHIKSTSKAQHGLYEYDAVSRLRDSQLGEERVHDIRNYIIKGRLWEAFESEVQPVLLIDEIDKADIEFPNDLLRELDRMEFYVHETRELIRARHRPIILITSNNEKELPDAFLRRCFFHYIRFPDAETMEKIVRVHFPGLKKELLAEALTTFFNVRDTPGLKKKPSTSELLDWIKLLLAEDIPPEALRSDDPKKTIPVLHGALLKNEQDVHLFEQLVFLNRRAGR